MFDLVYESTDLFVHAGVHVTRASELIPASIDDHACIHFCSCETFLTDTLFLSRLMRASWATGCRTFTELMTLQGVGAILRICRPSLEVLGLIL